MEEALKDALMAAGEQLAEAVRAGVIAHGSADAVNLRIDGNRVTVVCNSQHLRRAEFGCPGSPPSAPMEGLARMAAGDVVHALCGHLREVLR